MSDTVGFHTHALWWARVKARGRYPLAVVVGARKTGKTTWFERVAADPGEHVVLWPVIRAARLPTTRDVWREVWRLLGVEAPGAADSPLEYLEMCIDSFGHGVTLVVDEWDRAVYLGGSTAGEACYEVLDTLARFCLDQARDRYREHFLGLVLLSEIPSVSDLPHFVRTIERPTFGRLSGLITRSFTAETFPLLDRADSEALLAERGMSRDLAREVARDCGGWIWLLERAAASTAKYGKWKPRAIAQVRDVDVPELLDTVLAKLQARPEVKISGAAPVDYLAGELDEGVAPGEFGLPHDFEVPARPAPLISQCLTRTYMAVDTENLRMPFKKDMEARPGAKEYADGLDAFLERHAMPWLRSIADKHGVADYDILLVGRRERTIKQTVGPDMPGRYFYLNSEQLEKGKRKESDHSDDTLLTALVAQREARHRQARFVLVTGDMDSALILEKLNALRHVTVYTPWSASTSVRARLRSTGRLVEDTFPVPDPHRRPGEGS